MSDLSRATDYGQKALLLLDGHPGDRAFQRLRCRILYGLGQNLHRTGNFGRAVKIFDQAIAVADENGFSREKPLLWSALAAGRFRLGQAEEARRLFARADESSRDACGDGIRAAVLLPYAAFGEETGQHAQAISLTDEISRCSRLCRDVAVVQQALAIRSRSLFALGRSEETYRTAQEADRLKDSLKKVTNTRKIKELESKQQDLAKAREMEALNHEIHERSNRSSLMSAVAAAIVLLIALLLLFLLDRTRVSRQLRAQALALADADYAK